MVLYKFYSYSYYSFFVINNTIESGHGRRHCKYKRAPRACRVFIDCRRVPPTTCPCWLFSSSIQSCYCSQSSSPLSLSMYGRCSRLNRARITSVPRALLDRTSSVAARSALRHRQRVGSPGRDCQPHSHRLYNLLCASLSRSSQSVLENTCPQVVVVGLLRFGNHLISSSHGADNKVWRNESNDV